MFFTVENPKKPEILNKFGGTCLGDTYGATQQYLTKNGKPYIRLHLQLVDDVQYNSSIENKIKKKIEREIVRYAVPREFCSEREIKRTEMGKIDFNYYESIN